MNLKDIISALDGMACVLIDDVPAVIGAIELLKSQADIIANFQGHLGVDQKPEEDVLVEVYSQTMFSGIKTGRWHGGWPPCNVQDWHLWRPMFTPDSAVLHRSAEIRQQLGVVEIEDNGFYRLPEEET